MACPPCQRRSALVAALAPAISRLTFTRRGLLGMLALPEAQLLRAAKIENPSTLLRRLELPLPTESVPTATCRHDPDYPEALAQLDCAPAVLYATCTVERLRELLSKPTRRPARTGSWGCCSKTQRHRRATTLPRARYVTT